MERTATKRVLRSNMKDQNKIKKANSSSVINAKTPDSSSKSKPAIEVQQLNEVVPDESLVVQMNLGSGDLESKPDSSGCSDDNHNEDSTIEHFLVTNNDSSDTDMDIEDEDNDFLLQKTIGRNAEKEPATDYDLSLLHGSIMRKEDRHNDKAVKLIASAETLHFEWRTDKDVFTGKREQFTGTPGPTFDVTEQMRPTDVYYKMFDNDFIDSLCAETNRYAAQKLATLTAQGKLPPRSRLHRWTPTDRDEMTSFLTVIILQGLYPVTNEESYFSFNGFGTMPYFSTIMSYNRYLLLKIMLHFVDNESVTHPTKISKIQPVVDYFNKKFSELYYPSQDIIFDESLLKCQGRLGYSQKITSKAKAGIKICELCESNTGYYWNFFVYTGKEKRTVTQTDSELTEPPVDNDRQLDEQHHSSVAATTVFHLAAPLFHKGHTLIMDNFYNSPLLARLLKRNGTDCFGTLRLNREFVPPLLKNIKETDLQQGESVANYCSDLSTMAWRHGILVAMISTYHLLEKRTTDDNNSQKPKIVQDYNKSMGGIDKRDQIMSTQPVGRKRTRIWYKSLFRRMYNMAIFNCYVIYKTAHPSLDHRVFRTTLAEDLLKIHRQIDLTKEPRLLMSKSRTGPGPILRQSTPSLKGKNKVERPKLTHRHFPVRTGSRNTSCWFCCHQRKVLARTIWKCLECNVNLCVEGCFMEYHI